MFALAIWDAEGEDRLLLARDGFGIKPLYYTRAGNGRYVAFASELKALLPAGIPREIDPVVLARYLDFGFVPGDRAILRGVRAHCPPTPCCGGGTAPSASSRSRIAGSRWTTGSARSRRPWRSGMPYATPSAGSSSPTSPWASSCRAGSTRPPCSPRRPRSPRALFARTPHRLSGARRAPGTEPRGRPVRPADRAGLSLRRRAPRAGGEARSRRPAAAVAWHLDEPLGDPAAILTLLISERAAAECTVLLSGQGADELFAGYRVHHYDRVARVIERLPAPARRAVTAAVGALPWWPVRRGDAPA